MADDELRKDQEPETEQNTEPEQRPETEEEWPTFDWKDGIFSAQQDGGDDADATRVVRQDAPQPQPEPEPPAREPKKKKKHMSVQATILTALAYLLGVLLVSYAIATVSWNFANDLLALNKEELTATITIEEGETVDEIAANLKEAGLIEYPLLFKIFAAFTGKAEDGKIVSGTYELTTDMDYSALLTSIGPQSPVRSVVTVTIPEGYTMAEIFELLEENEVCSAEDLMEAAETEDFDYDFLDGVSATGASRLEGYLFPDTYEFYMQASATSVINKLLSNFETRFDEDMQARLEEMDMTMEEVMIVASIIEKETDGQDQKDIASVIYNRLSESNTETNGYLQMDSTIQYLLDERKETLTAEDLAIDSPYNTYLYPGLPVGCICCPGLDAIEAALNPNETDYYYFYLGNDGTTYFFSDYNAFLVFRQEQMAAAGTDSEEDDTAAGGEDDAA
ncbi:MAG: endolytic transglycosylase MltG [Clostridiales bacterium]|nr:endolytic transglycosylase MltG [Clostridiales bacterium]